MASRLQKRITLRRKFRILRNLANSKSVKKGSIIRDAFLHIYKLKLKLEAIKRECLHIMKHIQDVKVEKVGTEFLVRVTCKKEENVMVSILETFEEMGLNVLKASVSCDSFLSIEAIVETQNNKEIDATDITEAVHKAIAWCGMGTQN